ncbi:MAG: VOC family protein [Clostridiales bacterium]|nr:VOC family protein [Clostridiales bacterium]
MAIFTPNFNFGGHCEEAMYFYQKAFGAKIGCFLRYSDAQKEDFNKELTETEKAYIYHGEIFIGNQRIMMSDNMDIPFEPSLSLSLTVIFDTKEEVMQAYDVLKEECKIIYPVHSTTYSSCSVSLIDKFGFRWVLMTEQTER